MGVPVDKKDFVLRGRKTLEQKHPEVGHEIARHAVIGTIEQDVH